MISIIRIQTLDFKMSILEETQYQSAFTGACSETNTNKIHEELDNNILQIINSLNHREPSPFKQLLSKLCYQKYNVQKENLLLLNKIENNVKNSSCLFSFQKSILKFIRPPKKEIFDVHDPIRLQWIFQLRNGLSLLKDYKRRNNFAGTPGNTYRCYSVIKLLNTIFLNIHL